MAETLTVDTSPQTESAPDSLTPDEQDSLAVGEKIMADAQWSATIVDRQK